MAATFGDKSEFVGQASVKWKTLAPNFKLFCVLFIRCEEGNEFSANKFYMATKKTLHEY